MNYFKEILKYEKLRIKHIIIEIVMVLVLLLFIRIDTSDDIPLYLSIIVYIGISYSIIRNSYTLYQLNKLIKLYRLINEKTIQEEEEKIQELFNDIMNDIFNKHKQGFTNIHFPNKKLDNAYELLKISKTDTIIKIKSTYKSLAIKWHPDKWTKSTKQNQQVAERNFKKLQVAYNLIKKDKNIK